MLMTDDRVHERVMIFVAILLMALAVWMLTGCGTTKTKVVYEKVEVPAPYPVYLDNLKPLGPEPNFQYPHTTPEEAKANPTDALVVVGQDLNSCRSELKLTRRDYAEMLRRCSGPEPTPTPTPD